MCTQKYYIDLEILHILEHFMVPEIKEVFKMGIVERSHTSQPEVIPKDQRWNNLTNKLY